MVDGDDQLIGRQVFTLINSAYRKYPRTWVLYTNFYSSIYTMGTSLPIRSDFNLMTAQGGRKMGHFIGQLRTWKAALIRRIPLEHHQFDNGTWFDTLYDEALQHPFLELSGYKRIKYIPAICYLYTRDYGDNDYSTEEKKKHRRDTYRNHVLKKTPLKRLASLDEGYENEEINSVFINEANTFLFYS